MTGLERVLATVWFERTDRVPVIAQIFGHAARVSGTPLRQYLTDPIVLARCQMAALERYESEAVFALLDVNVETEPLGSRLRFPDDGYPSVEHYVLDRPSAVARLRPPNPQTDGRMPVAVEAARLLRHDSGDRVLVAGCVLGPMTLACQLLGTERALRAAADEPAAFERLLRSVDVALRFGKAQIQAGTHLCIVFDPSASQDVVPPAFFREFLAPRLRSLCEGLRLEGALANWLHIAGPTLSILPLYQGCSVDIGNLDYCVDPASARAAAPRLCLEGNIRPLAFVDSDATDIRAACKAVLAEARKGGFILSSGCEIPLEARPECVRALVLSAREPGTR